MLGPEYGIVGYTHAGSVDRPLVAYKTAGGNAGAVVVPHMNWRGLFSRGTNEAGGKSTTPVEWPGFRTTANHSMGETQASTTNWMGSLLEGQRDAGGLMYMRNRYYDPATGQFTQTDPIGIAGGLNTYGFAAGDPVSFADPYGLCPEDKVQADGSCPGGLSHEQYNYVDSVVTNNLKQDASVPLKRMLEDGLITIGEMATPGSVAQADHFWTDPSQIRLSESFFNYEHPGDAAHTLGHEYGHVIQRQVLGFTSGGDLPMTQVEWFEQTRNPRDGGSGTGYFNAQQADADRYGCSVAIGMVNARVIC